MKVTVIEFSEDGRYAEKFIDEVSAYTKVADFEVKQAEDLLDIFAMIKQSFDSDKIVLIAELPEKKQLVKSFYDGIASIQANSGKKIFKLLIEAGESADIIEFANDFLDSSFGRKRAKGKAKEEDLF